MFAANGTRAVRAVQGAPPAVGPAPRRPDPYFRPDACRRRRDVFLTLASIVMGSGLLGLIATPALIITAISGVALVGYIGALVYLRMLAQERNEASVPAHAAAAAPVVSARSQGRLPLSNGQPGRVGPVSP